MIGEDTSAREHRSGATLGDRRSNATNMNRPPVEFPRGSAGVQGRKCRGCKRAPEVIPGDQFKVDASRASESREKSLLIRIKAEKSIQTGTREPRCLIVETTFHRTFISKYRSWGNSGTASDSEGGRTRLAPITCMSQDRG